MNRSLGQKCLTVLFWIAVWAVILFLTAPMLVLIAASFTAGEFVHFPPQGLSLRWYAAIGAMPGLFDALKLSIELALISTLISLSLGIPAAIGIVRGRFGGRALILSLLLSPLLVPSVVTGIALLQFLNRLNVESTMLALVIGHTILIFPYVVRTVVASLEVFDWSLVETARILGAGPIRAFTRVILPSIRPGIIGGAIFAFLTSFDNYTISVFLSDAAYATITIRLFNYMQEIFDPTITALCAALIYASVIILVAADRIVGIKRLQQV